MKELRIRITALIASSSVLLLAGCGADDQEPGVTAQQAQEEMNQATPDPAEARQTSTTPSGAMGAAQPYGSTGTEVARSSEDPDAVTSTGSNTAGGPGIAGEGSSGIGSSAAAPNSTATENTVASRSSRENQSASVTGQASPEDTEHDAWGMDHASFVGYNVRQLLQTSGLSEQEIDELAANRFQENEVRQRVQDALEATGRDRELAEARASEIAREVAHNARSQDVEDVIGSRGTGEPSPQLEQRIRNELRSADDLALSEQDLQSIRIEIDEGAVELSGTVPSEEDVQKVEERLDRMDGIESIENNLQARR